MYTTGLNELLVSKGIHVVDIFRAEKDNDLWVNKIVELVNKKTGIGDRPGNNKPVVIKAIKYLEQASILESLQINKQKKLKRLTPLGKELINLMDDFESCDTNYTKLKDMIVRNNLIVGEFKEDGDADKRWKILKNKLLARGFNKRDIDSFDNEMGSCFILENMYRKNIMNCLLHRYSSILTKYIPNDKANSILLHVIMKYIFNIFSFSKVLEKINSEIFDSPERYYSTEYEFVDRLPFFPVYEWVLLDIEEYFEGDEVFSIKEMANISYDLILSLIVLLQLDKEEVKDILREFEESEYGGPKMLVKLYKNYLNFR